MANWPLMIDSRYSVEETHSVGTINNVETSYFTQLKITKKQSRRDPDVRRTSKHYRIKI